MTDELARISVAVPIPGRVEFRIPFTDRYLRDHRAEYETPEVRAYRRRIAGRLRLAAPKPGIAE